MHHFLALRDCRSTAAKGRIVYEFAHYDGTRLRTKKANIAVMSLFGLQAFITENDVEEATVDFDGAVVFDQAKAAKLVHEMADPRACRSDALGQHFVRDVVNRF